MLHKNNRSAFTILELVAVVGIIATLALIAALNYADAQIRSRMAIVFSDFRVLSTSIETYYVHNKTYPPNRTRMGQFTYSDYGLFRLTTPIAYVSNIPEDAFGPGTWAGNNDTVVEAYLYSTDTGDQYPYALISCGPDRDFDDITYDATNGLTSKGDIRNR